MRTTFNQMLAAALAFSILLVASPPVGFAQATTASNDRNIQKIKEKVRKLGTGPGAKVIVKLYNETVYKGYVRSASDNELVVVDKSGSEHEVKYSEIRSVGGGGLSTGAKIGLGIAIGAGAVLAVLALIVHSND